MIQEDIWNICKNMLHSEKLFASKFSFEETKKNLLKIINDDNNGLKLLDVNNTDTCKILFDVKADILIRNSFAPRVQLEVNNTGEIVEIGMRMHLKKSVKVLLIIMFCIVMVFALSMLAYLLCINGNDGQELNVWRAFMVSIIPVIMYFIGILIGVITFQLGAKRISRFFAKEIGA